MALGTMAIQAHASSLAQAWAAALHADPPDHAAVGDAISHLACVLLQQERDDPPDRPICCAVS